MSRAAVLPLLLLLLVAMTAPYAVAAEYRWDGGHDMPGLEGSSTRLYFAEGTTRNGFEEYLMIRNPGKTAARATVNYLFPYPDEAKLQEIQLAPGGGVSILVNEAVGEGKDVSILISSDQGLVAERQVYFNYKGVWTGGHVCEGAPEPSSTWYFAEGTTREGFKEWLCLQNPSDFEVEAKLSFMLEDGDIIVKKMKLGLKSRTTVDVNAEVGPGRDVSVKIEADNPIVAERPMYFDYKNAWRGGHDTLGSTGLARKWYFAEGTTRNGFEEWLSLMNPGNDTKASILFQFEDGTVLEKDVKLPGHARTTVSVNEAVGPEKDVSMTVSAGSRILCERPMYFRYGGNLEGGHVIVGSTKGNDTWYFPSAPVGQGFDSWLCVLNPNDVESSIMVEIFGNNGGSKREYYNLAPHVRATLSLNSLTAEMENPWVRVSSVEDVVIERPTYFSYNPYITPEPFTLAEWDGLEIMSPISYSDFVGAVFHEAASEGNSPQVLQPVGICIQDDNPRRKHSAVSLDVGDDPAYFVETSRGRGTYSTTACDVIAKTGAKVYAPFTGTVIAAESYLLYGRYPDLRVRIAIDGKPGYHVACLHMSTLLVSVGQRVEAGVTPIGTVRDLVPYFNSGPNPYTREEGNHSHIQINYRPDMASGNNAASAADSSEWP